MVEYRSSKAKVLGSSPRIGFISMVEYRSNKDEVPRFKSENRLHLNGGLAEWLKAAVR